MKALKIFTILSFFNTICVALLSPFVSVEKIADKLTLFFGTGCAIQFIALFLAWINYRRTIFALNRTRTLYIVLLAVSSAHLLIWIVFTIALYFLSHLFDGVSPMNFGPRCIL